MTCNFCGRNNNVPRHISFNNVTCVITDVCSHRNRSFCYYVFVKGKAGAIAVLRVSDYYLHIESECD